jgi:hypothetical protein
MSSVQEAGRIDDPPKETTTRVRLEADELGLDIYGLRSRLEQKGLVYRPYESET